MDARLQKLLKEHRASFALQPSGKKVVCKLNGHELPVRFDAVDAFIKCASTEPSLVLNP